MYAFMAAKQQSTDSVTAYLIGACDVCAWSLAPAEWLRRAFRRAGIADLRSAGEPWPEGGTVILVRADVILEEVLVKALIGASETALTIDGAVAAAHVPAARAAEVASAIEAGAAAADLRHVGPAELASTYNHALRKRAVPYALALTEGSRLAVEKRMFRGSYKGVTDFVTKWLWPWPAFWVTRWCAARRISPNVVTAVSLVLVIAATWLFARGYFAVGIVAAWLMTFLDTVDGKLARVTLTSTKLGNVFDHGIDLLHPPFWYVAWFYGLQASTTPAETLFLAGAAWIIVVGYVAGRLQEGFFLWRFGLELHAWRPLDSAFRLFTARRNPNLAIMTAAAVAGAIETGFLAVALWTLLSLLFHFVRIGQAMRRRRDGGTVRSWLAEGTAAAP